jgi:hypothetical protein
MPGRQPHPVRAALLGAIGGGVAVGGIHLLLVFSDPHAFSSSSTAPIGLIFLPFVTAVYAAPGAIGGAAIGYLLEARTRGRRLREPGLDVVALVAVALCGWGAATLVRGFVLGVEVRRIQGLAEPRLGEVLQSRLLGRNPFILAAVASNPRTSAETLDLISRRTDPELHRRMGTVFHEAMGSNRKGLAVMRLVARNPNVRPDTLERLAGSPDAYVQGDVAANPKLPASALVRFTSSQDYLVVWGVSQNPHTPPDVLDRLSRSDNPYTRMHVAWNPGTPPDVRARLVGDADEAVRNAAIQGPARSPEPGPRPGPWRLDGGVPR